jgi:hypothetical protein
MESKPLTPFGIIRQKPLAKETGKPALAVLFGILGRCSLKS